jgi:hypothetical protein
VTLEIQLWKLTAAFGGLATPPSLVEVVNDKRRIVRGETYTVRGQDEKKKVYRPVSAHIFDNPSRSKNSPGNLRQNSDFKMKVGWLTDWHTPQTLDLSSGDTK